MKTKIKDIGKTGVVVHTALSSKGDQTYEIRKDKAGDLSCECIGFMVRRTCRHLTEYLDRCMAHKEGR